MATVGPARAIVAAPAGGGVVKLGTRPVNGEQRCQESTSTYTLVIVNKGQHSV